MILTGQAIQIAIDLGQNVSENDWHPIDGPRIVVRPYDTKCVGSNSIDVHLCNILKVYQRAQRWWWSRLWSWFRGIPDLDSAVANPTSVILIPPEGIVLYPGQLYLGSTIEWTETHGCVPWVDGRSSIGRLGIKIHVTAGRGDDGFKGRWTLEIEVTRSIRVYPGMRIGQLTYFLTYGDRQGYTGRYQGQTEPTESRYHLR